jgi:hypothetical protein
MGVGGCALFVVEVLVVEYLKCAKKTEKPGPSVARVETMPVAFFQGVGKSMDYRRQSARLFTVIYNRLYQRSKVQYLNRAGETEQSDGMKGFGEQWRTQREGKSEELGE